MSARIVVTGAAGQLGRDVVACCTEAGDVVIAADRSTLDITKQSAVENFVEEARPDAVINCAAYTAVDACETNKDRAYAVNAEAVANLADAARAAGAHFVHLSTDYVFDGTLGRPYREDDEPNPQSVYGRSKLAGEKLVGAGGTVVRTSWVCGEHGANVVKTVLRLAPEGRQLAFVDDQRGCPTFASDLAPALRDLALAREAGIFHLTNGGAVSWFEFVQEVLDVAGFDRELVRPITTAELDPPRPAARPANSVLDNATWRASGRPALRHFGEPLGELVARLRAV